MNKHYDSTGAFKMNFEVYSLQDFQEMYRDGLYVKGSKRTIYIPYNPPHVIIFNTIPNIPDYRDIGLISPNTLLTPVYHGDDMWTIKISTTANTIFENEPICTNWDNITADLFLC